MNARAMQRLIHAGARELGLDDETRRDLQLAVTGKASMRDMTEAELARTLAALKDRGFRPDAPKPKSRKTAERGDVRFCHVLWRLLSEKGAVRQPGPAGLNAFIRARFEHAWGHVPIDIDAMRDGRQISDVVRALKDMCRRAGIDLR